MPVNNIPGNTPVPRLNRQRLGETLQVGFTLGPNNPATFVLWEGIIGEPPTSGDSHEFSLTGSYFYCVSGSATSSALYQPGVALNNPEYGPITYFESFCEAMARNMSDLNTVNNFHTTCSYNPGAGKFIYWFVSDGSFYQENEAYLAIQPMNETAKRLIGYYGDYLITSMSYSGVSYATSSFVPWYVWKSANPNKSNYTQPMEVAQGFWTDNVADDGTVYSWGKQTNGPILTSWAYGFEPISHVRHEYANWMSGSGSVGVLEPYTYDLLLRDAGANMPVVLHTSSLCNNFSTISQSINWGNKEAIYRFTAQSARFQPQKLEKDRQYWFSLPLNMRVLAQGTGSY